MVVGRAASPTTDLETSERDRNLVIDQLSTTPARHWLYWRRLSSFPNFLKGPRCVGRTQFFNIGFAKSDRQVLVGR